MKIKKISLALASLLLGGSCGLLNAEDTVKLDEVTVTSATMTKQALEDVPQTMEVFTAKDIQKSGARNALEVLEDASNIQVSGVGGGGINIRGMGSDQVVVLVNGRRQGGYGTTNENNGQILRQMDADNIERIEIIRGSAGALYGSNATGGIINIITKKSKEKAYTVTTMVDDLYYSGALRADLGNFGADNKWSAVLYGKYTQGYGTYDTYGGNANNPHVITSESEYGGDEIYLSADVGYEIDSDQSIGIFTEYTQTDTTSQSTNLTTGVVADKSYSMDSTASVALDYTGNFQNHTVLSSVSGNKSYDYEDDNGVKTDTYIYSYYNAKAMDSWLVNDTHLVTFGAEVTHNTASNPLYKEDKQTIAAGFLQDEITILDGMVYIIPAIRVENYSTFGTNATPSIAATWEFTQNHRLKATYGLGYRAPELIELYGEVYGGFGHAGGNEDLEPEESKNFEITYEYNSDNINASLGYYHSKFENYIDMTFVGSNPLDPVVQATCPTYTGRGDCYLYENVSGESTFQGIEAEIQYTSNEGLVLSLGHNYLDNEDSEGERIGSQAEHITTGKISYAFQDGLYTSLNVRRYTDYLYTPRGGNPEDIDFYTSGINISKSWSNDKYALVFAADNLLSTNPDYQNSSFTREDWSLSFTMKF